MPLQRAFKQAVQESEGKQTPALANQNHFPFTGYHANFTVSLRTRLSSLLSDRFIIFQKFTGESFLLLGGKDAAGNRLVHANCKARGFLLIHYLHWGRANPRR